MAESRSENIALARVKDWWAKVPIKATLLSLWEGGEDRVPLKIRVKAWWNGYDQREVERLVLKDKRAKEPEPKPKAPKAPVASVLPGGDNDPWGQDRIDIAQYIWGAGYCGPGGPDQIVSMTQLLALSPKLSMIEIGSGLGGPARALAENYGVWVTGKEKSENLVNVGNELSKVKGLGKKVQIEHFDPENMEKLKRNYDRAFSKEGLLTIDNKSRIFERVFDAMKPEGLFLITEYILGSDSAVTNEDYKEWKSKEPQKPYCITGPELTELMSKAGFSIRVDEDISKQYIELIAHSWSKAADVVAELAKDENNRDAIDTLLTEAEFWTRRSKLLKSGILRLQRILGYKKDLSSGMMSNW